MSELIGFRQVQHSMNGEIVILGFTQVGLFYLLVLYVTFDIGFE